MVAADSLTIKRLREYAIGATLFRPTTLGRAVRRLGFVQADPIRSPARAQDLILRHRVKDYSVGDLERRYSSLNLEEDFLYAYGFMPHSLWKVLHPRATRVLSDLELGILRFIPASQAIHPRDLALVFGGERSLNAWGSFSKTTTKLLHALHFDGKLRVAGRREGIRLYEHASKPHSGISDPDRLRFLVLQVAAILAPLPTTSLRLVLKNLSYAAPHLEGRRLIVSEMISDGSLLAERFGEIQYVWPEGRIERREPEEKVRFLAPFDPLVWDRARFEQLWGWSYRFEAYTPPAKRKLGYYALPMLWRDDVIGWVNIKRKGADLDVVSGFAKGVKATTSFKREFSLEVDRFRSFLKM